VRHEELIAELLGLCDDFFRAAGPVVPEELRAFLISRGVGRRARPGWFIDVLGFAAAGLEQRTRDRRSRGP
jgi:hypothetical protein